MNIHCAACNSHSKHQPVIIATRFCHTMEQVFLTKLLIYPFTCHLEHCVCTRLHMCNRSMLSKLELIKVLSSDLSLLQFFGSIIGKSTQLSNHRT